MKNLFAGAAIVFSAFVWPAALAFLIARSSRKPWFVFSCIIVGCSLNVLWVTFMIARLAGA